MSPKEFRSEWNPDELNRWYHFDQNELDRLPVSDETKEWLKDGFPENAAPFLNFGLKSYDGKFHSISNYYSDYELDPKTKNFWIFGSDGSGNPICIDSMNNDRVLLLDHEQEFEIIGIINSSVSELSQCLSVYRRFVKQIQFELGNDAFIETKFTIKHVDDLRSRIEGIRSHIMTNSDFWGNEIKGLYLEIEQK
ncbi:MAG: SUKH-4 family immunity protein [Cyclobacteriaceae bacterium]